MLGKTEKGEYKQESKVTVLGTVRENLGDSKMMLENKTRASTLRIL